MLFIWRGIGLVVPILFFITGWIVSFFFKDTRLGNPSYIGWTLLYAGIACILPAIGILGMNTSADPGASGEEEQKIKKV